MKKSIILIFLSLPLLLGLSGCAYNGFIVKSENQRFALAIQRFEFLRHHTIPVVKPSVIPPKPTGNKTPAGSLKHSKPGAVIKVVKKSSKPVQEKPKIKVSRIIGSASGLPVLTVNFIKMPLWEVLQNISTKTGYMFTSRRVNLGVNITLAGKYNLAELLNKLFVKETVKIKQEEKRVYIEG
jgi:hypothetical protein